MRMVAIQHHASLPKLCCLFQTLSVKTSSEMYYNYLFPLYQLLVPSLEELQAVVNQVVQLVSDIGHSIPCWTPLTLTQQQSEGRVIVLHLSP